MARNCETRRHRLADLALIAVTLVACMASGDDQDRAGKAREEVLASRRFELMRGRVTAGKVESAEPGFPKAFSPEPIFRYNDPTRGFVAGAVWKLGDEGRPKALLATELRRMVEGAPGISYEFSSLTATAFSLQSDDLDWAPTGNQYAFKPIPGAQAPGGDSPLRLRQLREIARRFGSFEDIEGSKFDLRLLPTPVDRYLPSKVERADGAIFLYTLGTNPELVLLIESDGKGWNFAAGRMTGAQAVSLTLDGVVAWEGGTPRMTRDSSFSGGILPIDIPGIAADGSDLPE